MKKPEHIILKEQEIDTLMERVSACNLEAADKTIVIGVLRFYLWLQWALQETRLSVQRLRSLFGFRKTEKRSHLHPALMQEESEDAKESERHSTAKSPLSSSLSATSQKEPIKGHGRLGHEDYPGAVTIKQDHESLKAGDDCPERCGGRLYSLAPKVMVCLTGHALASATRLLLARLRCSLCGQVFTASLPTWMPTQKYDEALKAHLAIAKNYAGQPFYRTEMLQKMVGVPLPDSTQWQLVESLADSVYPVYYELKRLSAQGEIVHHDDTVVRILSLIAENKERSSQERKGMYTAGIVSRAGAYLIYLFISSRRHSGENITALLSQRSPGLEPIIRMSDALNCNLTVEFKTILCHCLAHGRRKFYEIYDYFPGECRVVIDTLASVYYHDAVTKQEKLTPQERLIYHQTHSAPILATLKTWMTLQLDEKKVEPNSSLGKALAYMLNHWQELTRFLEVAGCPLDNNITERALKIPIRARKNSLFYKTEHGALVGGMLTSLIHTCVMAQKNPVHYLISLQKNKTALFKAPQDWLPWTYQETLKQQLSSSCHAA